MTPAGHCWALARGALTVWPDELAWVAAGPLLLPLELPPSRFDL